MEKRSTEENLLYNVFKDVNGKNISNGDLVEISLMGNSAFHTSFNSKRVFQTAIIIWNKSCYDYYNSPKILEGQKAKNYKVIFKLLRKNGKSDNYAKSQ